MRRSTRYWIAAGSVLVGAALVLIAYLVFVSMAYAGSLRWNATMIYRLVDKKIVEHWAAEDWTAILQAIGAFNPPWRK